MRFHVGSDVGGTFTDLWASADDGRMKVVKASTSADVISGVIQAVELAAEAFEMPVEEFAGSIERFGHGTTVGLNALLTGRAARTAVITTAGFADTLSLGRMKRQVAGLSEVEVSDYYRRDQWPPLLPPTHIFEVVERVDRDGNVVLPLELPGAAEVVAKIGSSDFEAIAICLLWATENPAHEEAVQELVQEQLPEIFVSTSHSVSPAVGEYARMSTTAANAAMGPVIGSYLEELTGSLRKLGVNSPILMMTCSGGVVSAESLVDLPVAGLFSGPAGGVVSSRRVGAELERRDLLSIDVGGTSFDVGTVVDGEPLMRSEISVAGADVRLPAIDVASIGAGGGSLASVVHGGLQVGPQSAGSNPGPACYGRGGEEPTATDADLVLGVLGSDDFAGGRMPLDPEAAERAVRDYVAEPLGMSVAEAAWGIRTVLDSKMADLLRRVTIERGHDPREFLMLANGGAGASHAWALCRDLGIPQFLVPPTATGQSAFGTGTSGFRRTLDRTVYVKIAPGGEATEEQIGELARAVKSLRAEAESAVAEELPGHEIAVEVQVAVRYRSQAHHLTIPLSGGEVSKVSLEKLLADFEAEYEALFGRGAAFREAGFEVLFVRATGSGAEVSSEVSSSDEPLVHQGTRPIAFDDAQSPVEADVYSVEYPGPNHRVEGPCVIVYPGQSVLVPPDGSASSDRFGNLLVTVGDG